MKTRIAVAVEVTDELTKTSTGKQKQVVYVDLGGRYPERDEIWVGESGPLAPGQYVVTSMRKGKFDIILDYKAIQPAPAAAKAS